MVSTTLTCLVDTIDQTRQILLGRIISDLHALISYLCRRQKCTSECSSMLLGALYRQMEAKGLHNPMLRKPFLGYSVMNVTAQVAGFATPAWRSGSRHDASSCGCTLKALLGPTISTGSDEIELVLDTHQISSPPEDANLEPADQPDDEPVFWPPGRSGSRWF